MGSCFEIGVVLSVGVFQPERRISLHLGAIRTPVMHLSGDPSPRGFAAPG